MIVDCALYRDGERREGDLDLRDAYEAGQEDGGFVWLGVHEPDDEEFDAIKREFDLHELAVEDAVKAHQRPKIEAYGDTLLVVLKTVRYVDSEEVVDIGELLVFVDPDFVITVRHGEASPLTGARKLLESRGDLLRCGPGAVLWAILDTVVDDYEPAVQGVEEDVQQVEQEVFSPERNNPAGRIYHLEREVLDFHRAVQPLAPVLDQLVRGRHSLVAGELHSYLRDVHDHVLRTAAQVDGFRELLSSVLQANLTQVSVRQNEDMRKISAWVAIVSVPTAVAAIYGMNFEHMPELKWTLGYPAVLLFIVVACVILYWRFRRSGWL